MQSIEFACDDVANALFVAVNRLPLTALERLGPGEVLSRLTNDTAVVGQMYRQTLQDVANTLCAGVGSVITVLAIDWRAGLVIIGLSSLMLLITFPLLAPPQAPEYGCAGSESRVPGRRRSSTRKANNKSKKPSSD